MSILKIFKKVSSDQNYRRLKRLYYLNKEIKILISKIKKKGMNTIDYNNAEMKELSGKRTEYRDIIRIFNKKKYITYNKSDRYYEKSLVVSYVVNCMLKYDTNIEFDHVEHTLVELGLPHNKYNVIQFLKQRRAKISQQVLMS